MHMTAPMAREVSYGSQNSVPGAPGSQHHFGQYQASNVATPVQQSQHQALNSYVSAAAPRPVPPPSVSQTPHANTYLQPRQHEVFRFEDMVNGYIPGDIIEQFHHDDSGRILWYTTPPSSAEAIPRSKQKFHHSLRYLADKARNGPSVSPKRSAHDAELSLDTDARNKKVEVDKQTNLVHTFHQVKQWSQDLENGTDQLYMQSEGKGWEKIRQADLDVLTNKQMLAHQEAVALAQFHETAEETNKVRMENVGS